jgi:hypothetical protein
MRPSPWAPEPPSKVALKLATEIALILSTHSPSRSTSPKPHWPSVMPDLYGWPRIVSTHIRCSNGDKAYPFGVISGMVETMGESGWDGKVVVDGFGGCWLDGVAGKAEELVYSSRLRQRLRISR